MLFHDDGSSERVSDRDDDGHGSLTFPTISQERITKFLREFDRLSNSYFHSANTFHDYLEKMPQEELALALPGILRAMQVNQNKQFGPLARVHFVREAVSELLPLTKSVIAAKDFAASLMTHGLHFEAEQVCESALTIARKYSSSTLCSGLLFDLARSRRAQYDPASAESALLEGVNLLETASSNKRGLLLAAHTQLMEIYLSRMDYGEAKVWKNKTLELLVELEGCNNHYYSDRTILALQRCAETASSGFEKTEASHIYLKALRIARRMQSPEAEAMIEADLGCHHQEICQSVQAEHWYRKALASVMKAGKLTPLRAEFRRLTSENLVECLQAQGKLSEAWELRDETAAVLKDFYGHDSSEDAAGAV